MRVKNVIVSALNYLDRAKLAEAVSAGDTLSADEQEIVDTLVFCFNAVEDEVARRYIPLEDSENLKSEDGKFYYASFSHSPVRIKKVTKDGEAVKYRMYSTYFATSAGTVTVEYEYSPSKKTISAMSDFANNVSERLLALGTASEYCLINGEGEASEIFEKKYRSEIDVAQKSLPECGHIPPRRWV